MLNFFGRYVQMKSKIGKISATILAVCSAAMSYTAFCEGGNGDHHNKFLSKDDYWALKNVMRKEERDKENARRFTPPSTNGNIYFPGMSTYIIGNNSTFKPLTFDELYDQIGYDYNIDTIVYRPGSFNIKSFCRVLDMNNVGGMIESVEPLNIEKDYEFPMSIIKNGYKYLFTNSVTGKTIEFDFVFGKTLPPQSEKYSVKNAIKAYNQYIDIFYTSNVYNPYGIDLCKVDENDVTNDVISDIVAANGWFIPSECFKNCRFCKELSLEHARRIYEGAFENCIRLETVRMPKVTDIGDRAFYGCKSLKLISMPHVKIIDASAFEGCENLESVYIPRVEYISIDAFKGCKNLKVIEIPDSARIINSNSFQDCSSDLRIIYGGKIYKNVNQFMEEIRNEE